MPRSPISTNLQEPYSPVEIAPPLVSNKFRLLLLISILILTALAVFAYLYPILRSTALPSQSESNKSLPESKATQDSTNAALPTNLLDPTPEPTPTPTPIPLPKEEQIYTFSHGKDVVGPRPQKGSINTLLPAEGQTQVLTLTLAHNKPVTKAEATLFTDTKQTPLTLTLSEGTVTEGTWRAEWVMTDTYDQKYEIKFSFQDDTTTYNGSLAYR